MLSLDQTSVDDLMEYLKAKKEVEEPGSFYAREGELVLRTLYRPGEVRTIRCKNCQEVFQTNYHYQSLCSRSCLRDQLDSRGLTWDPDKSEEDRWKGQAPSTIAPATVKALYAWAKDLVSTYESFVTDEMETISEPESKIDWSMFEV